MKWWDRRRAPNKPGRIRKGFLKLTIKGLAGAVCKGVWWSKVGEGAFQTLQRGMVARHAVSWETR